MADAGKPSIVTVLEHYGADLTTIRGGGVWQSILCPFHPDTNASGRVSVVKDAYRCMACDVSGDSWKIICDQEGVKFAEAKRLAASLFGYEGDDIQRAATRRRPYQPSWT
jgi:DNA primase